MVPWASSKRLSIGGRTRAGRGGGGGGGGGWQDEPKAAADPYSLSGLGFKVRV